MKDVINTTKAPAPVGPYNQAIRATGSLVFISGQIPLDRETGEIVSDAITEQTRQVMANLGAVLAEAGLDFSHLVKTTVYLADMNDFAVVNGIYSESFDDATAPARACVEVSRLPKDVRIEIDGIAVA